MILTVAKRTPLPEGEYVLYKYSNSKINRTLTVRMYGTKLGPVELFNGKPCGENLVARYDRKGDTLDDAMNRVSEYFDEPIKLMEPNGEYREWGKWYV